MDKIEVDNTLLEVLSFFEEMTFEMIILDWPDAAGNATREDIESSLKRLKSSQKIIEGSNHQGKVYKKIMVKRKKWLFF